LNEQVQLTCGHMLKYS